MKDRRVSFCFGDLFYFPIGPESLGNAPKCRVDFFNNFDDNHF